MVLREIPVYKHALCVKIKIVQSTLDWTNNSSDLIFITDILCGSEIEFFATKNLLPYIGTGGF